MDRKEFTILDRNAIESRSICSNCKRLLNVGPIHCYRDEENNMKEVCGRCTHIFINAKSKTYRQYAYERFAQYFTYPCSNKKYGCREILNWGQVQNHESVCLSVKCPLSLTELLKLDHCNWVGTVKEINEHIESAHKDLIMKVPEIDFEKPFSNRILFTRVSDQLVTIILKYKGNDTFYCLLMVNGNDSDSQSYSYQLELLDEIEENSLILQKPRLEPLSHLLENINNPNKILKLEINMIKNMLNQPLHVFGRFKIVRKSEEESVTAGTAKQPEPLPCQSASTSTTQEVMPTDESMLQELRCLVCKEYMVPPIYICQTGHSICSRCKPTTHVCPNCQNNFPGIRNYTLEKLLSKVNYPCVHKVKGCTFVISADKIQNHERSCYYAEFSCIEKCGYQTFCPNMYNHILENHPNSIRLLKTVYRIDVTETTNSLSALQFNSELFFFTIGGKAQNVFNFRVVHVSNDMGLYRYLVHIFSSNPLSQTFTFTLDCQSLFEPGPKRMVFPWKLIAPIIYDTKYFNYKVDIIKI